MTYKKLPLIEYRIVRSRNNGEWWSEIYDDIYHEDEAINIIEKYHKDHPSDWVKVIKVESSELKSYLGNKKKNIKKNKDDDFENTVKEMVRLGISAPLEEKYPSEKAEPMIVPVNDELDSISIANIVHPELLNI